MTNLHIDDIISARIEVLDKGFVELKEVMGDDLAIVNAARVSYDKESKELNDKDVHLLETLLKSQPPHSSPLEQVVFKFRIKLPIFVMRELVRHRTARLNEQSARFMQLSDEFYIPERWRKQDTKNKQSSFDTNELNHVYYTEIVKQVSENCYKWYNSMLQDGVAREMARIILPLNIYTTVIWQMDLSNLFKFLSLRNHPAAQWEIVQYAKAIESLVLQRVPEAFSIWKEEQLFWKEVNKNKDLIKKFLQEKNERI